jgi:thioredoxin reductase
MGSGAGIERENHHRFEQPLITFLNPAASFSWFPVFTVNKLISMKTIHDLPVAIIGAGPVGLAAAAHLKVRKQPFIVFEAGHKVAWSILSWKHIRVFSPWRYNIDKAARQLLNETGWQSPDDEALPTGQELYDRYFKPLAELPSIAPYIHLESKVLSVGRRNMDKMKTWGREQLPYVVQVLHENEVRQYEAKAVIDASGTWGSPNPIGSGGAYAMGELENSKNIFYGIPDISGQHLHRYKNKSVLVVGGGHSAINAILELDKLKEKYPATEIHWVLRKKNISDIYGGQENDALEARGVLGIKIARLVEEDRINVYTPFQIHQVLNRDNQLTIIGFQENTRLALPGIDEVISNTGSRPDFSFLREVRLSIDASLESVAEIAELIDPNVHSCGTVRPHGERELRHPDKDFNIAGSKSYGRAPTFLMATGYEQVRSVAAFIDGDLDAARKVELDLPETGVCSTDIGDAACCGARPQTAKKTLKTGMAQVACC